METQSHGDGAVNQPYYLQTQRDQSYFPDLDDLL